MDITKPATIANTAEFSRASSGTYRNRLGVLATAGNNVARFEYDAATAVCRLLVEAAATNSALRSAEFDNAAWTATNLTVTANALAAPDGNTTADKLVETAVNGNHRVSQAVAGFADNAALSTSYFVKAAERSQVVVSLLNKAGVQFGAIFDLAAGTAAAFGGMSAPAAFTLTSYGNGWYRCQVSASAGVGGTTPETRLSVALAGSISYLGVAANGLHVWGGQFEASSRTTSYIATTTVGVTRAADTIPAGCKYISNLPEADYAAWAAGTVYSVGDRVISTATHKIYESLRGNRGSVTITNASPGVVSFPSHGFPANRRVRFTTTGALPSPLVAGTDYYVTAANLLPDTFTVSATPGGAAINTTTAGSGVHTCAEVVNLGFDPTNPAYTVVGSTNNIAATVQWLEIGATNRWRMFDNRVSAQTTAADAIEFAILPGQVSQLGLLNLAATSGTVSVWDPIDGLVFADAFPLTADNVFDWFEYFTAPIIQKTDYVVEELPAYLTGVITVSLLSPGGTAKCGETLAGLVESLGEAQWNARPGILDYSKNETDPYGNRVLQQGNFTKRLQVDVFVAEDIVDETNRKMAAYRATPLLWVGDPDLTCTIIFGTYRDYNLTLTPGAGSWLTVDIEGL